MAKPAATIINATAKTRSAIEDLQARLTRVASPTESIDDLERELEAYFDQATPKTPRAQLLEDLKHRVIEGVVDRILAEWASGKPDRLGREVMDRLIERVLEEFRKSVSR